MRDSAYRVWVCSSFSLLLSFLAFPLVRILTATVPFSISSNAVEADGAAGGPEEPHNWTAIAGAFTIHT